MDFETEISDFNEDFWLPANDMEELQVEYDLVMLDHVVDIIRDIGIELNIPYQDTYKSVKDFIERAENEMS